MTDWGVRYPARDGLESVVEVCADEAAARELAARWPVGGSGIELVQRPAPRSPWQWVARPGQEYPPCDRCIPDGFGEPIDVRTWSQLPCEHVRRGRY